MSQAEVDSTLEGDVDCIFFCDCNDLRRSVAFNVHISSFYFLCLCSMSLKLFLQLLLLFCYLSYFMYIGVPHCIAVVILLV